jgi:hypothetical protein
MLLADFVQDSSMLIAARGLLGLGSACIARSGLSS